MSDSATTTELHTSADASNPGADSSRKAVVGCQQLSKVFKDFWMRDRARAVDKLDLVIYEHEIFGLLGPNGSGKSTIIKMILGLLKPTNGRVAVFGKPPTDVATKKRIGYLPEESYLYPFLNARETLDYYGKLFGLDTKTRQGRIDELLHMVGLEHAQFRPVREYSKGMQRRIGLAQALINDPDLLILDEPTTGLDPIGTRQVKDLIIELGRRGKTIILSSHLLTDVEDVVDRMAILYGGKIRDEGTCDSLLSSKERTLIEADELDDQTIAEIDEIIRRRSSGAKSIRTVSAPKQRLEDIFMGIVEQAQTEKTETSGAMHGGATAAFLMAADSVSEQGSDLISSLVDGSGNDTPESADAGSSKQTEQSDSKSESIIEEPVEDGSQLIGDLLGSNDSPDASDGGSAQSAPADEQVDLGVIGSLTDEGDETKDTDSDSKDKESNQ